MSEAIFPKKLLRKHFDSDDAHLDDAYKVFTTDFLDSKPHFRGKEMKLKYLPKRNGREATFHHMTTEGDDEESRQYDEDRTERLPWARPLIENESTPEAEVRVWQEKIKGEWRIHLWLYKRNYMLVIAQRGSAAERFYLPWTAFAIQYNNQERKYERRWKRHSHK